MNFLDEFKQMACRYSDKTALIDCNGTRKTTYRELYSLCRKIEAKLSWSGNFSQRAVLVCMDRRMEYIAAEIGILMAGAAFVPVLPQYPKERIDDIKKNCQAAAVIDESWMLDLHTYHSFEKIKVPDSGRAMIIYTSGQAGRPKGIVQSMEDITRVVRHGRNAINLTQKDVLGAIAPMSFVILLFEYFSVLSCGGCVHILPEEVCTDVSRIEDYYAQHEITCAFIRPQILKLFKKKGTSLQKVAAGSERVSMACGDGCGLYNWYDSSEAEMMVASYRVETGETESLNEINLSPEMILKDRTREAIAELYVQRHESSLEKFIGYRQEYPLTDSQAGVYMDYINDPDSVMYNIPLICELPEAVEKDRFVQSVKQAVAMHPSFGVNIVLSNGNPMMYMHEEYLNAKIEEFEADDLETVKKTFVRPFALDGEPLYRTALWRCRGRIYFLFDVHHIIFDGASAEVFLEEISFLYREKEPKPEAGFQTRLTLLS